MANSSEIEVDIEESSWISIGVSFVVSMSGWEQIEEGEGDDSVELDYVQILVTLITGSKDVTFCVFFLPCVALLGFINFLWPGFEGKIVDLSVAEVIS